MMKKTFEIKGVDLTSLYGVGDKNIIFLEKQLPLQLNVRGNNIFCQGLKKDINHFDMVLLDPPRDGAQAQIKEIVKSHIDHVVYVSCNPISFAKDARHLCTGGFRLKRLTPIDQFVHTYHVEMVSIFERVS